MTKANAFIFDIDGTLSDTSRRRHHVHKDKPKKDWEAFFADQINDNTLPTAKVLKAIASDFACDILLCTGRGEEYRQATEEWLSKHDIHYDVLYMRPADDKRDDTEIKLEIYNNQIKPKYNVLGVFEDRLRLVRMWREQGLFVFNCNQNDEDF